MIFGNKECSVIGNKECRVYSDPGHAPDQNKAFLPDKLYRQCQ